MPTMADSSLRMRLLCPSVRSLCWIIFLMMYIFCFQLSLVVIYYDYLQTRMRGWSYLRLVLAALLEPFFYHPFIMLFSLRGYLKFIMGKRIVWGEMQRKGFNNPNSGNAQGQADNSPGPDITIATQTTE